MKGERIMKLEKEKMKYLITGDKHSHFSDVFTYIASVNNPTTITIIVLGDAGINYYGFPKDILFTKRVANNCSLYLHKAEANK